MVIEAYDHLEAPEEYFSDRSDADCDQDGYIPNEEMRRLHNVQRARVLLERVKTILLTTKEKSNV